MRLSAGIAALVIVILAVTSRTGHSQPKCAFTRYSVEDGLSEGVALTMHQDREGLMWFGTFDGLNRFDGYNFKVYKPVLRSTCTATACPGCLALFSKVIFSAVNPTPCTQIV